MSTSTAIYNLNGVPLFTYGMIGITTVVLAVVTMMDTENTSFAKDEGYDKTVQTTPSATGENEKEKKEESMFTNMFGSKPDTNTGEKENEKKEESMFSNMFGSKPAETPKTGGKYGNRKTKHNKRQNTYTRKN